MNVFILSWDIFAKRTPLEAIERLLKLQKETFSPFKTREPIVSPWQVITIQDSALLKFYGMMDKPMSFEKEKLLRT